MPITSANPASLTQEQQQAYATLLNHLSTWAAAYVCRENWLIDTDETEIRQAAEVLGLAQPEDFANDVRFWVSIEKNGHRTVPIAFD